MFTSTACCIYKLLCQWLCTLTRSTTPLAATRRATCTRDVPFVAVGGWPCLQVMKSRPGFKGSPARASAASFIPPVGSMLLSEKKSRIDACYCVLVVASPTQRGIHTHVDQGRESKQSSPLARSTTRSSYGL